MQGTDYNNGPLILDRWTPSTKGNSVPRVTIKDQNQNRTFSTLFIEDGSYARMKYITLGYTLNENLTGNLFSKLRLYLTLQNPLTFTKYTGYDPEIGAEGGISNNMFGVDKGVYPQARTYILGLNLNF